MKTISLKLRWKQFLSIVGDPWVLILVLASGIAGYVATSQTEPKNIAIMTFVAALTSGVLGGVLAKRWSEITDEQVIFARGKTAVRGLMLLLNNLGYLEKRTQIFLDRCPVPGEGKPLNQAALAFEEIVGRCRVLQEEAVSSVENWTDIVPEADVKTQIGVITALNQEREALVDDIRLMNEQLTQSADKSKNEVEALQAQIKEKEDILRETQLKLAGSQATLGGYLPTVGIPSVSGFPSSSLELNRSLGWGLPTSAHNTMCDGCRKMYSRPLGTISTVWGNICDECRLNATSSNTTIPGI